eukprot:CAMPEP_0119166238 /NCGR_PEP_ID=MMETSP1315-20130426/5712_1 /TAXON_ID=676789 /ORGANISM="Prasinoderma singularis, Strain RCC927" /LENGTH=103 /DNA_ID=CAMNT_0007159601 /DNA_START=257 /DNA_END=565 /DNA_ORIENTATION=-
MSVEAAVVMPRSAWKSASSRILAFSALRLSEAMSCDESCGTVCGSMSPLRILRRKSGFLGSPRFVAIERNLVPSALASLPHAACSATSIAAAAACGPSLSPGC